MKPDSQQDLNRRGFLRTATRAGASLALGPSVFGSLHASEDRDPVQVALIGAGAQGRVLMETARRIPGVRFRAVCDIWPYHRRWAVRRLNSYKHDCTSYEDFREMLAREEGLDAVLIATPDIWHAEQTTVCLNEGLHVYCEPPMSNTIEGARRMVATARTTGRLLQIGQQRRSNPRYRYCHAKVLAEMQLLGRMIAVEGQWNRAESPLLRWPDHMELDEATLNRYGYDSMHQLRNWRRDRRLGSGPLPGSGVHQVDVYNWFLRARPTAVLASESGAEDHEKESGWPEAVMAIYEYQTDQGPVQASYRVLHGNSSFGHFEAFLGDQGTLIVSESSRLGEVYREPQTNAKTWRPWIDNGYLEGPNELEAYERNLALPYYVVHETPPGFAVKLLPYKLPVELRDPRHLPHLTNFFDALRNGGSLTCPPEVGYQATVTILKAREAAATGRRLEFKPEEFTA